mgnify:CR=1 FL=1
MNKILSCGISVNSIANNKKIYTQELRQKQLQKSYVGGIIFKCEKSSIFTFLCPIKK